MALSQGKEQALVNEALTRRTLCVVLPDGVLYARVRDRLDARLSAHTVKCGVKINTEKYLGESEGSRSPVVILHGFRFHIPS
jgi:hypothetical protein